jgi:hypothetical protein
MGANACRLVLPSGSSALQRKNSKQEKSPRACACPRSSATRLCDEEVQILEALWKSGGKPINFEGKHYQLKGDVNPTARRQKTMSKRHVIRHSGRMR